MHFAIRTEDIYPGDLAINDAYEHGPRVRRSEKYARAVSELACRASLKWHPKGPMRTTEVYILHTASVDIDSPVKGILDALQQGRVLVDDKHVLDLIVFKAPITTNIIDIEVFPWAMFDPKTRGVVDRMRREQRGGAK